jgi:hypothetical protein
MPRWNTWEELGARRTRTTAARNRPRRPDFAPSSRLPTSLRRPDSGKLCRASREAMSDKPGGYVGQDFGELSRAAVLDGIAEGPCHVSLGFILQGIVEEAKEKVKGAVNSRRRTTPTRRGVAFRRRKAPGVDCL